MFKLEFENYANKESEKLCNVSRYITAHELFIFSQQILIVQPSYDRSFQLDFLELVQWCVGNLNEIITKNINVFCVCTSELEPCSLDFSTWYVPRLLFLRYLGILTSLFNSWGCCQALSPIKWAIEFWVTLNCNWCLYVCNLNILTWPGRIKIKMLNRIFVLPNVVVSRD